MAGRPPIDLNQKVRDLLTHTIPPRPGVNAPIRNFEERTNACFNLIKYIDDHILTQSVYRASYDLDGGIRASQPLRAKTGGFTDIRAAGGNSCCRYRPKWIEFQQGSRHGLISPGVGRRISADG